MSVFINIQRALDQRLNAGSFGYAIAWENTNYTPVEGTSFIRPTTLYATGTVETLARLDRYQGIYQIDVFVELEKGTNTLNTILDAIRDHFIADLDLVEGSDTVIIRNIGRLPTERDRAWIRGSVEVNFECYTA